MDNPSPYLPEELQNVCTYCQVVMEPFPTLPVRAINHRICPACKERVMLEWRADKAKK